MQQRPQALRVKRPPCAVNEIADAEFVRFTVMGMAMGVLIFVVKRCEPARCARCLVEIETPGIQHLGKRHFAETAHHLHRTRIDAGEDALQTREFIGAYQIGLVHHQYVAEFNLLDQQFDQRSIILFGRGDTALGKRVG